MNEKYQLSDEEEEASSQASEFVDATHINDGMEVETESVNNSSHEEESAPIRIQNDMAFLQESWANLAEHEDVLQVSANRNASEGKKHADVEGATLMKNLERDIDKALAMEDQQNLDASGFQVVVSKSTKKSLKAKTSPIKTRHKTRTKPSNLKPFK